MSNLNTTSDDREIDLSDISRKMGSVYNKFNNSIFRGIQFLIRNIIIIVLLFAIGIGIGIYLDKTQKTYDHQIVVRPNFESVDYLYSKIDLLNAKIKEKDVNFLKSIGLNENDRISKLKIEPVVDVYGFINRDELNFQIFKLMSDEGDIKKIIEEAPTSRNYPLHLISFKTSHRASKAGVIDPLMKYLNESEFYNKIQQEYISNVQKKMVANEQTISQIDGILNKLAATTGASGSNLVYVNENTQLNDVLQTKDKLILEQGYHRIELLNFDRIVKDSSITINMEDDTAVNGKLKILLPLLFVGFFIFVVLFRRFYRNQKARAAASVL